MSKSGQYKKLRRPFKFVEGDPVEQGFAYTKGGRVYTHGLFTVPNPLFAGAPVAQQGGAGAADYSVVAAAKADNIIGYVNATEGDFKVAADGTRTGTIVLNGVILTGIVTGAAILPGALIGVAGVTGDNGLPDVSAGPDGSGIKKVALQGGAIGDKIDFIEIGGV